MNSTIRNDALWQARKQLELMDRIERLQRALHEIVIPQDPPLLQRCTVDMDKHFYKPDERNPV